MKFEAIDAQRSDYPVEVMCRILDVSKSGYYDWRHRADKRDRDAVRDQKLVRLEAELLRSK